MSTVKKPAEKPTLAQIEDGLDKALREQTIKLPSFGITGFDIYRKSSGPRREHGKAPFVELSPAVHNCQIHEIFYVVAKAAKEIYGGESSAVYDQEHIHERDPMTPNDCIANAKRHLEMSYGTSGLLSGQHSALHIFEVLDKIAHKLAKALYPELGLGKKH